MHLPPSNERREHNIDTDVIDDTHPLKRVRGLAGRLQTSTMRTNAEYFFEILATPHVTLPEQRSVAETREERSEAEFQNESERHHLFVGGSGSSIKRVVFGTW